MCLVPQAQILLEGLNVSVCTTPESAKCMMDHLYHKIFRAPIDSPAVTGCQESCTKTSYQMDFRADPSQLGNINNSHVFLLYDQTDINVREEVLLFDFGAILAAVGGSLGLFLGFSCRGFLMHFVERIYRLKAIHPTKGI